MGRASLHAVIVHDKTVNLERHIRYLDPRREPAGGGFWVEEIGVSTRPDAADDRICGRAVPGDVVVTKDTELTLRCLRRGARVVDGHGAAFSPWDLMLGGEPTVIAQLRRTRRKIVTSRQGWKALRLMDTLEEEIRHAGHDCDARSQQG